MMKKYLTLLLLTCFLSAAYAERPNFEKRPNSSERMARRNRGGQPFEKALRMLEKRPEIAKELGITDEQVEQLKAARKTFHEKNAPLGKKLRTARKTLEEKIKSDEATEKEIMTAVENAGKLQINMKKEHIRLMLEIKSILGKEIFQKIQNRSRPPLKKRENSPEKKDAPPWMKTKR